MSIYLHYTLTLRSPAIVSTLSGDPNRVSTQPFIPGSAIRGALATRLLAGGAKGDSAEFRHLILSSDVRYLHAYPKLEGDRALPTPAAWKSEKNKRSDVHDLAAYSGRVDVDSDDFEADWPQESVSSSVPPFRVASGTEIKTISPRRSSRVHQQRDREKGRSWKDEKEQQHGALFAFEYLEANQVFCGVIQIRSDATTDIDRIKALLDGQCILVGRSRRAGYGGEAEINFTPRKKPSKCEYENVNGWIKTDIPPGTLFRAMLTSAYVGRHRETGQIDPVALEQEFVDGLGATIERRRWSFETLGAFNRTWRLEVPQAHAVAAGAEFVLKAEKAISVATLHKLEHDGLGERRTEGFGRVLFLVHRDDKTTFTLCPVADKQKAIDAKDHSNPVDEQLAFLEERIVLAAVRAELDRIASIDIAGKAKSIPTNSLLGRIRTLFRAVMDKESAQDSLRKLETWCGTGSNALKDKARKHLEKCTGLPADHLLSWLGSFAKPQREPKEQWDALVRLSANASTLNGLAKKNHLTSSDHAQAVLHDHSAMLSVYLVDGVLAALARRKKGETTHD